MKKLFIGLIIGLCIPPVAGYFFLILGGMPVATKGPALPLEKFVARTAIHAAMKGQSDLKSPIEHDETNLQGGVKIYKMNCAVCHGLPKSQETAIAKGLFPRPPQLFGDETVTDDPVGKIYWKVKNGIRLTGMPGFVDTLTDTEIWQVSLLLQSADKLSDTLNAELSAKKE